MIIKKSKKAAILVPIILILLQANCVPPAHTYQDNYRYKNPERKEIVRTAKRYIGANYKYGGDNLFGFDCSGFVMQVYKKHGLNLPRSARAQYKAGKKLRISAAKPGDLIFFIVAGKKIDHVGIYLGGRKFIHAPSKGKKVSYARIDNTYWKKRFAGVASYLK